MAVHGVGTSAGTLAYKDQSLSVQHFGISSQVQAHGNHKRQGHNMGYIEIHNADGLGGWVNFDDIPFIEIINCQLCNEPTEARDIVANIVIREEKPVVGAWQCRKCHAVNG